MKHAITFHREGKDVIIQIATNLPSGGEEECYMLFRRTYSTEADAELRLRYFRERHTATIQEIRKEEFVSGWKHAKAKKKGLKFFSWFMGNMKQEATYQNY